METIIYHSRNRKNPPFEVTVEVSGRLVHINCNCPLGIEKKICRHKINAIRGDREQRAASTSDAVIERLKRLFGARSTLRQHLEEKWRMLREYSYEYPDNEEEISKKRKILGEAFANGFVNEIEYYNSEPFDIDVWEADREIYADGLSCSVELMYEDSQGDVTNRKVNVEEVFMSNFTFYISGYCHMRNQVRTFRVDRIIGVIFDKSCKQTEKSLLLDVFFQGNSQTSWGT